MYVDSTAETLDKRRSRISEFIPYSFLRCARRPNLVNGTLERNDNTLFSICWRMRVGIKKNLLTKLNNDNMKEFAIAMRIAKDQRGRMAEKSCRARENLSRAAAYWSSIVAANPIQRPRIRALSKIWMVPQKIRTQHCSARVIGRVGRMPDLGMLMRCPEAHSKR